MANRFERERQGFTLDCSLNFGEISMNKNLSGRFLMLYLKVYVIGSICLDGHFALHSYVFLLKQQSFIRKKTKTAGERLRI